MSFRSGVAVFASIGTSAYSLMAIIYVDCHIVEMMHVLWHDLLIVFIPEEVLEFCSS